MRTRRASGRVSRKTKQRNSVTPPTPQTKSPTTDKESTPPQTSGSELNNGSGGSPSSVTSPSSSPKKPRTDKRSIPETSIESTLPESEPEGDEKIVMFLSQYLCISLWRALQSCEIWDSRLVTAFAKGPQTFSQGITQGVTQLAKTFQRKLEDIQPESLVEHYLSKLRPSGLYSSCAKILQKTKLPTLVRSLKRKKVEVKEQEEEDEDHSDLLAVTDGKYKYRFVMDEPRLIIVNGPQKDDEF